MDVGRSRYRTVILPGTLITTSSPAPGNAPPLQLSGELQRLSPAPPVHVTVAARNGRADRIVITAQTSGRWRMMAMTGRRMGRANFIRRRCSRQVAAGVRRLSLNPEPRYLGCYEDMGFQPPAGLSQRRFDIAWISSVDL